MITTDPAVVADVTAGGGGWLYNATTGGIWIDHADYCRELTSRSRELVIRGRQTSWT